MILRVIKRVFGETRYFFISLFAFLILIVLAAWLPNLALVKVIPLGLISALPSTLGLIQFAYLLIVSMLFSISLSFSIYYIKHSGLLARRSLGVGGSGLVLAVLGLGCASCGSLVLTPVLGLAAGGFLAFLPLRGFEIAGLGLTLLAYSFYNLARKIDNPYT
ncbi:MAG TPA: hypothetical protein VJB98_01575 [Candidatus Paceibacterota bacterium]